MSAAVGAEAAGVQSVPSEEARLVASLRRRDERAFALLVDRYHTSLVRLAAIYVRDRAVAEEVAQDTWVGVLRGIDRFEGRASLKTWIFRILTNTAKTRGEREGRTIPFSALVNPGDEAEASVDPDRFLGSDHPVWPGHWASPPSRWDELPEARVESDETLRVIREAIDALPPAQAGVITLRDIEGCTSGEVCELLGLSEANQRVLLHRARSRVRRVLEDYLADA